MNPFQIQLTPFIRRIIFTEPAADVVIIRLGLDVGMIMILLRSWVTLTSWKVVTPVTAAYNMKRSGITYLCAHYIKTNRTVNAKHWNTKKTSFGARASFLAGFCMKRGIEWILVVRLLSRIIWLLWVSAAREAFDRSWSFDWIRVDESEVMESRPNW